MSKMPWKDFGKTGLKLAALGLVNASIWFIVAGISALVGIIGVGIILLWIPISFLVSGYLALKLWKWR